jgi:choline-glycine betaine transporter
VSDGEGNSRTTNMLWGSGHTQLIDKVHNAFEKANVTSATAEAHMGRYQEFYGSHSEHWMDWWTIFYWGE